MDVKCQNRQRLYTIEDLENLLEYVPYEIWLKDKEGRHVYINQKGANKLGLKKEDIIGKTDMEIRSKEFWEKCKLTDDQVIQEKKALFYEDEFDMNKDNLTIETSKNAGYINNGELVVITAGVPVGISGTTNLIKVHVISEEIVKGIGIGSKTVEGKVRIVKGEEDCIDFNEGDILVTTMTDIEMNPYIEKCAAIITEEGGMTSHAAIVGISLNKPVIVSATNILESVKDGEIVTVDASRGVIYRGSTRVL